MEEKEVRHVASGCEEMCGRGCGKGVWVVRDRESHDCSSARAVDRRRIEFSYPSPPDVSLGEVVREGFRAGEWPGFLCTRFYELRMRGAQVEEGTPFAKRYTPGEGPLPSDEQAADMYRVGSATLQQAGYEHYEISNFAKPGHRCAAGLCVLLACFA